MMLSISTEHGKYISISMNYTNSEIFFDLIIPIRNIRLLTFNSNEGLYRWINLYSHLVHGLELESNKGGFQCKLSDPDDVDFWRD